MREIFVNSPFTILLRIHVDGETATQADLSAITWRAVHEAGAQAVVTGTLVVADVVSNEVLTDGKWTADSTGYNVTHNVSGTALDEPGIYSFEYTVTPSGGYETVLPEVVNVRAKART